ncbi:hypothetical protein WJU16_07970 [Chitinophaga pollutisoli]|uniref:Uncharacterized protein n=1 Tax=Chitinophaga pollutisoli TaxID=3133966 RepID=A0ABZ2YT42_9BACT
MRQSLRIAGMILALFLSYNSVKAQVKIGGDPATVDPNAILELESSRKGLLLPRLDRAGYELLVGRNPQAGMVIYIKDPLADTRGVGFYVKTGAAADKTSWTKLAADNGGAGFWKVNGNDEVIDGDWLGTKTAIPLIFKVNGNNTVMQFDGTSGQLTIPYANVPVAGSSVSDVVMIDNNGLIHKKDLSLTSVTSLNSFQGNVTVKVSPKNTFDTAALKATSSPNELDVQLPIMAGGATQEYGFMTIADWKKLQAITSTDGITIGNLITSGALADNGARIERLTGADEGKLVLRLVEASATAPGIVSVGAQTFAGNKSFTGTVSVAEAATFAKTVGITGNTTVGGTLGVTGEATFAEAATFNKTIEVIENAAIAGNTTLGGSLGFNNPVFYSTPKPLTYRLAVLNPNNDNKLEMVEVPAASVKGIGSIRLPRTLPAPDDTVTADGSSGALTLLAGKTGNAFNIATDAPNTLTINIPDASTTASGVVTTGTQTFNGIKTVEDTLNVGGNTTQTSRFNLNSAMSVPFKILNPGNYIMGNDDYIVVTKCDNSAVGADPEPINTVTLPAATDVKGRMYTIRRARRITNEIAQLHIADANGVKIDGQDAIIIYEPNFAVTLVSDGAAWHVISRSVM